MEEQEQIDSILAQASEWGLETEVTEFAERYIEQGHSPIDAYHYAFEDWIK